MAPRHQPKRGKKDEEAVVDSSAPKRIKAEPDTNDAISPNVRTTRSLRGLKAELKTPLKKEEFTDRGFEAQVEIDPEEEQDPKGGLEAEVKADVEGSDKSGGGVKMQVKVPMEEEEMTEYERARKETMARNEAMLLALGVQEAAQGLGLKTKKAKAVAKGLQTVRAKKDKKEPVVVRRSSRIQHIAPESLGIERENRDGSVVVHGQEAPFSGERPKMAAPWEEKQRLQGPLKFRSSNMDDVSSDAAFLETLKRLRDDQPLKKRSKDSPTKDPTSLNLKESDVARVVKDRIFAVTFLPTTDKVIVAAGDKSGGLGMWDVDADTDHDGVHVLSIGPRPVSALAASDRDCTKLYTCSFDGSIRVLDVEKGVFDEAFVSDGSDFSAMALGPSDGGNVAYVGDGGGALTVVDLRSSTARVTYEMHGRKINTIDFHPHRSHIFVTGGTDAAAYLWDVRKLPADTHKKTIHPLVTLPHVKAVNSIYFSPDGQKLASTSYDNYIRVYGDMETVLDSEGPKVSPPAPSMIDHYNNTGRWISSFRAVWTWDSQHVAIGSMNRAIDIVNVENKQLSKLASEDMPTIPARNAVHPLLPIIAGGVAGGKLHIWR